MFRFGSCPCWRKMTITLERLSFACLVNSWLSLRSPGRRSSKPRKKLKDCSVNPSVIMILPHSRPILHRLLDEQNENLHHCSHNQEKSCRLPRIGLCWISLCRAIG